MVIVLGSFHFQLESTSGSLRASVIGDSNSHLHAALGQMGRMPEDYHTAAAHPFGEWARVT